MTARSAFLLMLCLPAAAAAQINYPLTAGFICDQDLATLFTQNSLPTSSSPAFGSNADTEFTPSCDSDGDVLFCHAPLWRLQSDSGLTAIYDSGVSGDQGGVIDLSVPDVQIEVIWADLDNRGLLSARWLAGGVCDDGCIAVFHQWELFNTSPAEITIEFYAYCDLDYTSASNNSTSAYASSNHHMIEHPSCPGERIEFGGQGPDLWEVDSFPVLSNKLATNPFPGLSNGSLPFTGDYTGAMGWTLTIPAGESVAVNYGITQNRVYCGIDALSSKTPYGSAYGAPPPAFDSSQPYLGCELAIDMQAMSFTTGSLLFALNSANFPYPGCPHRIYVDNVLASVDVSTDASGEASVSLNTPPDPSFCGFPLYLQAFFLNPAEPCLQLDHTEGIELVFGT